MPTYRRPSGPNETRPPLWFENGCFTNSSCFRVEGTTTEPFVRKRTTRVSPFVSV